MPCCGFSRRTAHPVERVWAALTDPAELTGAAAPAGDDRRSARRAQLRPDGDGTLLAFSSTLELPAGYRTMVLAGWHWHLDALAGFLGGTPADLVNVTGWDQIHQRYA
jgi:hypothetical protein